MADKQLKRRKSEDAAEYDAVLLDIEGTTTPITFVKVLTIDFKWPVSKKIETVNKSFPAKVGRRETVCPFFKNF